MALQFSTTYRNNLLDQFESTVGVSAKLQIRTGAQPSDCSQAAAGTLLCEIALPSDWMAAASTGSKAKTGTWSGTAVAGGTAAHFRIVDSAGTTCHCQGTVGQGSGDLSLDNTNIANGQTVTVNTFSFTAPGA